MMSQPNRTTVKAETAQDKQKRLTVNIAPETHRAFKVWCTQQGREMSEVIIEYVERCLKQKSG